MVPIVFETILKRTNSVAIDGHNSSDNRIVKMITITIPAYGQLKTAKT